MIGAVFRQAVVMLLLVFGIAFAVNRFAHLPPGISAAGPATRSPAVAVQPVAQPSMANSAVYQANPQGHVFVDVMVNGAPIRFLVDTGATFVSLTRADAAAAGFANGDLDFSGRTTTANGVARVAPVRLREVRLGEFSADDVPALVGENLGMSLLGQSFLNRLSGYQMRDGALTLSWN